MSYSCNYDCDSYCDCNRYRDLCKGGNKHHADNPCKNKEPIPSRDVTILGTPHWDNSSEGQTNRVRVNKRDNIVFDIRTVVNSGGSLGDRYPATTVVFNDAVPSITPVTNIESLTPHLANLQDDDSQVHIRLEVARRIVQGFANYTSLVKVVDLEPGEKFKSDIIPGMWSSTRALIDSSGNPIPGYGAFTNHTLSDLTNVLSNEALFNYPIANVGTPSPTEFYPTADTDANPIPTTVISFNIGAIDSSIPSEPSRTYFKLSQIDVKLAAIQRRSLKVTM